jgi:hypothetical protein
MFRRNKSPPYLLLSVPRFLSWLIIQPREWRQYVPPKQWLIFSVLHSVGSQKKEPFFRADRLLPSLPQSMKEVFWICGLNWCCECVNAVGTETFPFFLPWSSLCRIPVLSHRALRYDINGVRSLDHPHCSTNGGEAWTLRAESQRPQMELAVALLYKRV